MSGRFTQYKYHNFLEILVCLFILENSLLFTGHGHTKKAISQCLECNQFLGRNVDFLFGMLFPLQNSCNANKKKILPHKLVTNDKLCLGL